MTDSRTGGNPVAATQTVEDLLTLKKLLTTSGSPDARSQIWSIEETYQLCASPSVHRGSDDPTWLPTCSHERWPDEADATTKTRTRYGLASSTIRVDVLTDHRVPRLAPRHSVAASHHFSGDHQDASGAGQPGDTA